MGKFIGVLSALLMMGFPPYAAAQASKPPIDPAARGYLVEFAKPQGNYSRLGPVGGYYPDLASRSGVNGAAVIECDVGRQRELRNCSAVAERPVDWGFTEATMRMAAARYIVAPDAAEMPARANFIVKFELPTRRR